MNRIDPNAGERELDELSGLLDLVKPFAFSGTLLIPVATTTKQVVVVSNNGKGREGLLVAFALDNSGEDYVTSTWAVETCSRQVDATQAVNLDGVIKMGPFNTPVGSLATPFIMPFPLPIGEDNEIALTAKNGTGADVTLSGFLYGITWSKEQNRDVRRALWAAKRAGIELWQPGLFSEEGAPRS